MKRWGIVLFVLSLIMEAMAQRIRLDFQNVSMAYALSEIDKHFPETKIQFIHNNLEQYKVTAHINHRKALDAVREVVGFYPMKITVERNNIFVEATQKVENVLSGTLIDENKQPVAYATIMLRNPNDSTYTTGGISNEDGFFAIPMNASEATMRITSIGYHSIEKLTPIRDVGNVLLTSQPYELDEVIVRHSQLAAQLNDGFLIQVIGTPLEHRGTVIDLLTLLPGLKVEEGRLYTLDNRVPNIFINNIPVNTISELHAFTTERISHILFEERESVVRIYTTEPQNGWNAEAQATASQGKKSVHRENMSVAWNNDHWQLSGGISYQQQNSYQEHFATDMEKIISPVIHSLTPYAQLVYKPNTHHLLGMKYEMMDILKDVAYWSQIQFSNGNGMSSVNNNGMSSGQEMWLDYSPMHNANLFYKGHLGKVQVNLDLEFYTDKLKTHQEEFLYIGKVGKEHSRVNTSKNTLVEQRLEVKVPVAKHEILVGNEYSYTQREDEYWYSLLPDKLLQQTREEKQLAMFAQWQRKTGNLMLQAGMRYEHVDAKAWGNEPTQTNSSDYILPNAEAVVSVGNTRISASFDMQTKRPNYNQLNGYSRLNQHIIFVGVNPNLKQALLHNANLQLRSKNIYANLKLQYIKDFIGSYITFDGNKYKLNYQNLSVAKSAIATVLYNPTWGKFKPRFSTSMLLQDIDFDFGNPQSKKSFNHPVWFVDVHLPWALTAQTQLWTEAHYHSTGHIGTTLQKHSGKLNLGITHQISNWNLSLQAEDVLKTGKNRFTCYGNNLTYQHWSYNDTRRVMLTVSYRLNPSSVINTANRSSKEKNRF